MNTAWMLVLVMVLGGKEPETRVVVQRIVAEKADCDSQAKRLDEMPPTMVDDASGRPVMTRSYTCTPISPKALQRDLDKLPK